MLSRVLQLPFVLILDMNTETEDDKGEQRAARLHIVIIDNVHCVAFLMFFLPNLLLLLLWMNAMKQPFYFLPSFNLAASERRRSAE